MKFISGLCALGLVTAGCSGSDSDPDKTLTVQFSQGQEAVYQAYAQNFEKANPGVKVNLQAIATATSTGSNLTVITSDNAPDVALVPGNSPAYTSLVSQGGLRDLSAVWTASDLDKRYPEATNALTEFDGKHYAIADSTSYYSVVYYNVDLFQKAGITAPADHRITSVQQLADMATALRAQKIQPLAVGGKSGWEISWMLDALLPTATTPEQMTNYLQSWRAGTDVTAKYTDPGFAGALNQIKALGDAKVFQEGYLGADNLQTDAQFQQGQTGMRLEGSWFAAMIKEANPNLKFGWMLLPPVDPAGKTQLTGSATPQFSIPTKAKNPELAEKYLNFMLSDEQQVEAGLKVGGYLPAVNTVADTALASLDENVQQMIADSKTTGLQSGWTSTVPSTLGQALVDPQIQALLAGDTDAAAIQAKVQAALETTRTK
ncbi:ABC transporter substrate-binding protein [Actinoplanes couchii]|uniref:ABC transporter substrate-binding protein n=1 Tax=Actinoplanes couchii TaxID=403638 RepID=UPI001940E8AA|nr:extracellular solute-binding protein [Actinoplanes couchii]MDR6320174.1 raffinose/stachyose/melibiose transport system substrate-binding protein [Actinoplanes couchii]